MNASRYTTNKHYYNSFCFILWVSTKLKYFIKIKIFKSNSCNHYHLANLNLSSRLQRKSAVTDDIRYTLFCTFLPSNFLVFSIRYLWHYYAKNQILHLFRDESVLPRCYWRSGNEGFRGIFKQDWNVSMSNVLIQIISQYLFEYAKYSRKHYLTSRKLTRVLRKIYQKIYLFKDAIISTFESLILNFKSQCFLCWIGSEYSSDRQSPWETRQ